MEKKILLDAIYRVLDAQMKFQNKKHDLHVEKKAIDSKVEKGDLLNNKVQ